MITITCQEKISFIDLIESNFWPEKAYTYAQGKKPTNVVQINVHQETPEIAAKLLITKNGTKNVKCKNNKAIANPARV